MNKKENGEERPLPELLAPAGGYDAAIRAFESGADAVYFGMKNFSARKGAKNFTEPELYALKKKAAATGKKMYAAVNTIIRENEIDDLLETLEFLSFIEADAVIIQDPGIIEIAARWFPNLSLHSSTQMAVHNAPGIREMLDAGIRRLILPRELTFVEIQRLRAEFPTAEFEIFAHGALCYGFSGLCLASGLLLGRSGNRGECAQICRSHYRLDNRRGYYFSCNDLSLAGHIDEFIANGIDAIKIEGRMKSPEYVAAVVSLYRKLLDRVGKGLPPPEDLETLKKRVCLTFSRKQTNSFFNTAKGDSLISADYPGHRGIEIGVVVKSTAAEKYNRASVKRTGNQRVDEPVPPADNEITGYFRIRTTEPLTVRDGLCYYENMPTALREQVAFSIRALSISGRPTNSVPGGSECDIGTNRLPPEGAIIYKISDRNLDLPGESVRPSQLWKRELDGHFAVRKQSDSSVVLSVDIPAAGNGSNAPWLPFHWEKEFVVDAAAAEGAADDSTLAAKIQTLFSESGDSQFRIRAEVSMMPDAPRFIRPSLLKTAKREFYGALAEQRLASLSGIKTECTAWLSTTETLKDTDRAVTARNGWRPYEGYRTPYLVPGIKPDTLTPLIAGDELIAVIPLFPVLTEPTAYFADMRKLMEEMVSSGKAKGFLVLLDNPGHLAFARELAANNRLGAMTRFTLDWHLYTANRAAVAFYRKRVPNLDGAFGDAEERIRAGELRATPPLFISRGCFSRHSVGGGKCPEGCARRAQYYLQGRQSLEVEVIGCWTMVFEDRTWN